MCKHTNGRVPALLNLIHSPGHCYGTERGTGREGEKEKERERRRERESHISLVA